MSGQLPGEVSAALKASEGTDLWASVEELDGYSSLGPILIPFSDALDPPEWTKESPGELEDAGKGFARLYDITLPQRPEAVGVRVSFIQGQNVLVLRPARPLDWGHRILVCLVGPVQDRQGRPVVRPALFDAVMRYELGLPEDPLVHDLEEVRGLIRSGALPISAGDVLLAFSYWTNSRTGEIHSIRQAVDDLDARSPILPEDVYFEDPLTVAGTFRSPEFRLDGMIPAVRPGEDPAVQGWNRIKFLLRLPEQTGEALHPLVYLHGLDFSRWTAPTLEGFGVFAIDAVEHGDRMEGEPEGPLRFINMPYPRKFRDNVRQTAADHMALARMIVHLAEDPTAYGLPQGLLAADSLSVLGFSLGCINGTFFASIDPHVDHVLAFSGGGMMAEFLSKSLYGFFMPAAVRGLPLFEQLVFWHLVQAVLDPGDPAALVPGLMIETPEDRPPRNVLLAMVIGDRSVPNACTQALAWGAGLGIMAGATQNLFGLPVWDLPVEGNLEFHGRIATGLLVEFEIDATPILRHDRLFEHPPFREQMNVFFETAVRTGVGRIIDPYFLYEEVE